MSIAPSVLAALVAGGAPSCAPSPPSAPADPFTRFELSCGIRVAVLHVEDAPLQSAFSFLPLGLIDDDADAAQFAHLVEHLLIRSTDPDALEVDGLRLNGETTTRALRLEALGPPERWREGLARHARWLAARDFDAATLAREKQRIAAEERGTVPAGATHKWASAAWHQVVAHGARHVALHGDVAGVGLEAARDYVRRRVAIDDGVRMLLVGPVPPRELREALEADFAGLPSGASSDPSNASSDPSNASSIPGNASSDPGEAGSDPGGATSPRTAASAPADRGAARADGDAGGSERSATWDLDAHHYLEWYPLPAGSARASLAGELLAQAVSQALLASDDPRLAGGSAFADAAHRTAEGPVLLVTAAVEGADDARAVRAAVRSVLAELGGDGGAARLEQVRRLASVQLSGLPDFTSLRRSLAGRPGTDLLEAQLALATFYRELRSGLTLPEAQAAVDALSADELVRTARTLTTDARSSLLLSPPDRAR